MGGVICTGLITPSFIIQDNEAVENIHESFDDRGVDCFDTVITFGFVRLPWKRFYIGSSKNPSQGIILLYSGSRNIYPEAGDNGKSFQAS